MRLLDDNLTLSAVLERLAEMKVAAVAAVGEIDDEAHDTANRLAVPLFTLPGGTNVAELEQFAIRVIVERQADMYRLAQEAYRQLTESAIGGRGLPAIVERLSHMTGKPVAMQDQTGEVRLYFAPRDSRLGRAEAAELLAESEPQLQAWAGAAALSASDPPVAQLRLPDHALGRLVAPILGREGVAGFLSLLAEPRLFGEVDRMAVARGAAACAIELARRQAAIDAQDQLQIGVVDELTYGQRRGPGGRARAGASPGLRPHAGARGHCPPIAGNGS